MSIPRSEYPRPQFVRPDWLCLNGEWQFEMDQGDSGLDRGLLERELNSQIIVPFSPESKLSGIGNLDYMSAVWYRREVSIPAEWGDQDVLLHFQAVDFDTTVWVDGKEVGRHRGGFSPFTCNLRGIAKAGDTVTLVVRARDNHTRPQPRGKQSRDYHPEGANYVRTTGIWQTVWLEPVPRISLRRPRITPDVANRTLRLEQPLTQNKPGYSVRAILKDDQGEIISATVAADFDLAPRLDLPIPEDRLRLWAVGDPYLYDLEIELVDERGGVVDRVTSYAGMRSISINGTAIKINGKPVFQRLVLDQGYYAESHMTPPSEEAIIADIELSIQAGFNGARLHQKVFEERFLYHADRLGYMVWGEFGDWGCSHYGSYSGEHQLPGADYITQWLEVLERDYSHPSIVGWCPLNETWQSITDQISALDDVTRGMYLATKAMDTTRPVLDTSGYSHRVPEADVYDSHDYDQNPDTFAKTHAGTAEGKPYVNRFDVKGLPGHMNAKPDWSIPYQGQPYFVSEFGGIWWNPDLKEGEASWGYGSRPTSLETFYDRFERLCAVLLDDPSMFGYCYTQLTDVFQEQNGIYKFDRSVKFDMARIRAAQQKTAAFEKSG